jgi:lipopolysaccharide export LptBFGC system permease protein LptF
MEQEYAPPEETTQKKYIRNYTEEGREKQKNHLNNIRQKAMEKKRELKEITLKAKLMKLEPKIELAKQYDEYVNSKPQIPEPEPEPEQIVYVPKPAKQKQKKIIYKEVEEEEEEEEVVYIKKNKPKPQESLDRTLYKSSTEQLHLRAVEERIKNNLAGWHGALMPREY